jgi:hypothetical protein
VARGGGDGKRCAFSRFSDGTVCRAGFLLYPVAPSPLRARRLGILPVMGDNCVPPCEAVGGSQSSSLRRRGTAAAAGGPPAASSRPWCCPTAEAKSAWAGRRLRPRVRASGSSWTASEGPAGRPPSRPLAVSRTRPSLAKGVSVRDRCDGSWLNQQETLPSPRSPSLRRRLKLERIPPVVAVLTFTQCPRSPGRQRLQLRSARQRPAWLQR